MSMFVLQGGEGVKMMTCFQPQSKGGGKNEDNKDKMRRWEVRVLLIIRRDIIRKQSVNPEKETKVWIWTESGLGTKSSQDLRLNLVDPV